MSRKYWPQNVGCGADDRGRDVSWRPTYRESEPLFGHFTNHECLLGRNQGRPLNTENMSRFLDQVSKAHKEEFIIMVVDGASSHKSK
jgi:hypothetical protein